MVGLILAILIIFGYRLFWPSSEIAPVTAHNSENKNETVNEEKNGVEDVISSSQKLNVPNDESKRKLMAVEFERLEEARNDLKRHIALLKHQMWGLRFPPEVSKKISQTVLGANRLLKNPHMLGAFHNVEQIKDEIAKIDYANSTLVEVDEIVKAKLEEEADKEDQSNSAIQ